MYDPGIPGHHTCRTEGDDHLRIVFNNSFRHPVEFFVFLVGLDVLLREIASEALKSHVVVDPERFAFRVSCDELDVPGTDGTGT
jgi:hypothetical protein